MRIGFVTFSSSALQAHQRLLHNPPGTVRTHFEPGQYSPQMLAARRRDRLDTIELNHRILALKKKGMWQYEIAAELGVSLATVSKHVNGHISSVKRKTRKKGGWR